MQKMLDVSSIVKKNKTRGPWATPLTREAVDSNEHFDLHQTYQYHNTNLIKKKKRKIQTGEM